MEFDRKLEQWSFLTADNKYWSVEAASGIQASSSTKLVMMMLIFRTVSITVYSSSDS